MDFKRIIEKRLIKMPHKCVNSAVVYAGFSVIAVETDVKGHTAPYPCTSMHSAGMHVTLFTMPIPVTEISLGWRLIEKSLTFKFVK